MSRGVNKVILVGNLGLDPEMRYLPSGSAVTNVSVATNESWKDKQTGQQQDRTEWHRVVMFNRLAEIAGQYLKKGSQIYLEGRLQTRKWQDQSGMDRYTTEIIALDMQMLSGRQGGDMGDFNQPYAPAAQPMGGAQPAPNYGAPPPPPPSAQAPNPAPQQAAFAPPGQAPQQAASPPPGGMDDFDDDIPF